MTEHRPPQPRARMEAGAGGQRGGRGEPPHRRCPNSLGNDTTAAAVSGDPHGQKTKPGGTASPGHRSHISIPCGGSSTGGRSPLMMLPGHHPAWLLPSFPASSRDDPFPRSRQRAGAEAGAAALLSPHTHCKDTPFLGDRMSPNTSSLLQCWGHPSPLWCLLLGVILGGWLLEGMLGRWLPGQRQWRMAGCSRDMQGRGKTRAGSFTG